MYHLCISFYTHIRCMWRIALCRIIFVDGMLQTKMSVGDLERTLICTFVASSQCWDEMGKYFE